MDFKIKHLQLYLSGQYNLLHKSLGVELVELGFLNYRKLTAENYEFWWYEIEDKSKIDRKSFTYNWSDLIPTRKIEMIKKYIAFHNQNESMYKLITAILNIESAMFDGIDMLIGKSEFEKQIEFYYAGRLKKQPRQAQLFFNYS